MASYGMASYATATLLDYEATVRRGCATTWLRNGAGTARLTKDGEAGRPGEGHVWMKRILV